MKKYISLLLSLVLMLGLMPVQVFSAEETTEIVLQAGKNYEIYNTSLTDGKNIKTTIPKNESYDLVSYDVDGTVNSNIKNTTGSIYVYKSGKTIISPTGSITVYLPNDCTIKEVSNPALFKYTLKANTSYEFTNASLTEGINISNSAYKTSTIDSTYDYVSYNSEGIVSSVVKDTTGAFYIYKSGYTVLTTHGYDIEMWMPYSYLENTISIKEVSNPALFKYTLKANTSYEFTNASLTEGINISNSAYKTSTIDSTYDYVSYNSEGIVSSVVKDTTGAFYIYKSGYTVLTTHGYDIEMWMPYSYLENTISIKEVSNPALFKYTLKANTSYEFTNASLTEGINISNSAYKTSTIDSTYDYVSYNSEGKVSSDVKGTTGSFYIYKSGYTVITLHGYDIEMWIPYSLYDTTVYGKNLSSGKAINKPVYPNKSISITDGIFDGNVYLYGVVDAGASLTFDIIEVSKITDSTSAKNTVASKAKDLTNEQKESATGIDKMTVLAEGAVANVASTTKSEDTIHITETVVKELEPKAVETAETLEKTLTDNGVNTQRTITKTVKVKSTSSKKTVKVVKDTAETAVDTVKVETDFASVSIPASAQTEFELTEQDTNKVAVTFDTDKTTTMKISFPGVTGDTTYMAVVDETGKAIGGKYNPATGELEAKISESGVYSVVYNEKDFEDIKDKSAEMQNAIKTLAAKGIINGTSETTFSPDASISRAEIAALIVRTLSKLDPNEDGGFVDVTKDNWFFGVAGSSRKHGIINGYEDNTFRGNNVILKEQIIAVTARVLRNEMNYKTPENVSEYLTYTDTESLPGWAKEDIALAEMANIVLQRVDGQFVPQDEMTRGDAAIILMRLFNKIW